MAKVKKKEALSLEVKLKQALLPVDEQPYEVPENWCWTKNNIICQLGDGSKCEGDTLPYLEVKYLRGVKDAELLSRGKVIEEGTKVILVDGENSGEVFDIYEKGYMGSTFKTLVMSKEVFDKYLLYFIRSNKDLLRNNKTGSAIPHLNKKIFFDLKFPLPPLAEQQRIVEKIESLFKKLDEAKEKLVNELDKFEDRKMAILHEAYLGNLTAEWRNKNSVSFDTWIEKSSSELFEYVTSGSRGWAKYYSDAGALFIRMGNLDHGTIEIDFEDTQHVNLPDKAEGQRSLLKKGDILISITADVGMIGLVRELSKDAYINQHVALARPVGTDNAEFLAWYLVSDVGFVQMRDKQRGATKVGLGLDDIRSIRLKMPSIREQEEVVRIINELMRKEEQVKTKLLNVVEEIASIKKSILAKAFRGELGTNNPDEESAVELLKSIIEQEE